MARQRKMTVVGRVPFDPLFTRAMIAGQTVIEYQQDAATARAVQEVWEGIINSPAMNSHGIRIQYKQNQKQGEQEHGTSTHSNSLGG